MVGVQLPSGYPKGAAVKKIMTSPGQWGPRWPPMPVDDTPENLAICMNYCGICPSLPSPPTPFLFCARGKANTQPIERKGCSCVQCDVWKE